MASNKKIALLLFIFSLTYVTSQMAKNIYSDPDLSNTSGKFEGFTIDFRGIDTPAKTYWSLCNWRMDLTEFKKTHSNVKGGGAYGGLQRSGSGVKTSILSFWEVLYTENGVEKSHRATRIYPKGDESTFGGEGEGTNYIHDYDWPTNIWHRYTLRSWIDPLSGETFVGQWLQNLSTGEWTLFAYFNTKLINSYITGGLSQFQENYIADLGNERSFQIKNMYALDKTKNAWISLDTSTLSYDPASWGYKTAGTHEFGYTYNYFFGSSGLPVDNQKVYDDNNPPRTKGTINQPSSPNFSKPEFDFLNIGITSNYLTIMWRMNSKTTPCYKYSIQVLYYTTKGYNHYKTDFIYNPEVNKHTISGYFSGKYQVTVTCSAISNVSVSKTVEKEK